MPCFVSPDIIYACNTCRYMYDVYNACTYIISWPRFASLKRTGLLLLLLGLVGDGTHGLATGKTTGTASRNETDLLMCVAHGRQSRQRRGAGGEQEGRRRMRKEEDVRGGGERKNDEMGGRDAIHQRREQPKKNRRREEPKVRGHISSSFIYSQTKMFHLCLCRETKGFHVS